MRGVGMSGHWTRAAAAAALAVALGAATLTGCSGDGNDGGGGAAGGTTTSVAPHAITPARASELAEAWRIDGQAGVTGKPTVRGGTAYFGTWTGSVQAVDLKAGEVQWQTQVAAESSVVNGALLVTDDLVYGSDSDAKMYALDRATGEMRWTQTLDAHPDATIYSTAALAPD